MPPQDPRLARGDIPEADRLILARRSQRLPVRREGHAVDRLLVPRECLKRCPRGRIPQTHLLTLKVHGGEDAPVWGELYLEALPLEALDHPALDHPRGAIRLWSGRDIPEADRLILAR